MVLSFLSLILLIPAVTVLFYSAEKYWKAYSVLNPKIKTWIVGIVFGLVAVFFTEIGGVNIGTAVINSRDAAAVVAAFCFYPEAGIIAGLIGGIERYFSAYWGVGVYSHLACGIATSFAGFFSYYVAKNILLDERPKMLHGIVFGLFIESFHMLITVLTHLNDIRGAFIVLYDIFEYQIITNQISITIAFIIMNLFEGTNPFSSKSVTIRRQFNQRLLIMMFCILFSILIASSAILSGLTKEDTRQTLKSSIDSVKLEIDKAQVSRSDSMYGIVESSQADRSGFAVIYSDDMDVISGVYGRKYLSMDAITENIELAMGSGIPEYKPFKLKIDNIYYYTMYTHYRGMHVFVSIPVQVAEFSIASAEMMYLLMLVTTFAVFFVIINNTTNKIVLKKLDTVVSKLSKISNGNLDVVVDIGGNKEFNTLSKGINVTVEKLKAMIKEASKRIDDDLKVAREIQNSSLPSVFPPFPDHDEFDIYASMKAAKGVGGDLYDFFFTDINRLFLVVADVSGKGIPAALFMMRTKTLIRSLAEKGLSVSEVLHEANKDLVENNGAGLFVTALIACVDTRTGKIIFGNAGHNPPIIKHDNGKCEYLKLKRGFILAGMPGSKYGTTEMNLQPGDTIFMYTDGITEAINKNEDQYGEDRLLKILSVTDADTTELCKTVATDVRNFAGNVPQFDDETMLCFKFFSSKNEK